MMLQEGPAYSFYEAFKKRPSPHLSLSFVATDDIDKFMVFTLKIYDAYLKGYFESSKYFTVDLGDMVFLEELGLRDYC